MSRQDQSGPGGELLMYRTSEEETPIRVLLEGDNVWLPQRLIADLYDTSIANINQHIKAIYKQGELRPKANCRSRFGRMRRTSLSDSLFVWRGMPMLN